MTGYALALTSLAAAFWFPPLALFLYMVFSTQETAGVGVAITGVVPSYALSLGASIAGVTSLIRLWHHRHLDTNHQRLFFVGALAMATIFWMGASSYFSGGSLRGCLELMSGSGIYAATVTAAYSTSRWARRLFVAVVFIHVGLSFLLFTMPDGPWERVAFIAQPQMSEGPVGSADLTEGTFRKQGGQFGNATQTGFYAMVAVVLGVWLVRSWRTLFVTIGTCAVIAGVSVTINALMRGIILGAVVAAGIVVLRRVLKSPPRMVLLIPVFGLSVVLGDQVLSRASQQFGDTELGRYFLNIGSDTEYRALGIAKAIPAILTRPVFGTGGLANYDKRELAHQSPLAGAVLFGLPVGCAAAMFLWWGVWATARRTQRHEKDGRRFRWGLWEQVTSDTSLLIALGWLVAALDLSNGSYLSPGGALGWICAGAACLPWAVRSKAPQQVGTLVRASYGPDQERATIRRGPSPS